MNIVIIMSGGVGVRFGAAIPKQYNLIEGKPVIDYVIDAVQESKLTDKVIVVMDPQWIDYSGKLRDSQFDFAVNGTTRFESMYNGLKLIKEKYPCDRIVIVDAVAPFIYSELIDDYFSKLEYYDAIITSQKITGGFTDIYNNNLDRENYIITQSPEGFRFELLWNNFDLNFSYQETAGMLPKSSKRYYNFNFKYNLKLTYDFELFYAEFMLRNLGKINHEKNVAFFEKSIFITEGLKSYLLRIEREKTLQWIDEIYISIPKLIEKWSITSFLPNQISRFGLVLQAKSKLYGEVIIKFIPKFTKRFERELEALRVLPSSYMCDLIDVVEECNCMLLKKIVPASYACFEENIKLTTMFKNVVEDAVEYDESLQIKSIPLYVEELEDKLIHVESVPYYQEEIEKELRYAVKLFEQRFKKSKLFILHGDLHEQNILDDGEKFWAIDPNGFIAPIEFECVRFIRNDVRNHPSFGYKERFEILINNFARFVNKEKLINAFIIDMAFCTYNSAFENENSDVTKINLLLIEIAKKYVEDICR